MTHWLASLSDGLVASRRRAAARRGGHGLGIQLLSMVTALVVLISVVVQGDLPRPLPVSVVCDSVGYSYDAAGRLVGVQDQSNQTATYGYDAAGNITSVQNRGTQALAVLSFSPAVAVEGAAVTISGGCFSDVPAENAVFFNGTAGVVTSASSRRIVASVPAGATTGPITVTVGGQSAVSSSAFTVDVSRAPAIIGVSPSVVAAGGILTVTGQNFGGGQLDNIVSVNNMRSRMISPGVSSLQVEAPAGGSGRVKVATAHGVSADTTGPDVFIVPAPYGPGDVADAARITAGGASRSFAITSAGRIGLYAFDQSAGAHSVVSVGSSTFGSCGLDVKVLDPRGLTIAQTNCIDAAGSVQFTAASAGGYSVVVDPVGTAVGSAIVQVGDPIVPASVVIGGSPTTVSPASGQQAVISFDAVAGQVVVLMWSNLDTAAYRHYYLRRPDGSELRSNTYSQQAAFFWEVTFPVTGTYTLLFNPGYDPGSATVQIVDTFVPFAVTIGGPAVTATVAYSGQQAVISFDAVAGQVVVLMWSNLDTSHARHYYLRKPDGSELRSNTYSQQAAFFWEVTFPVTGTYTLLYNPGYNPASATVQIVNTFVPFAVTIGGPAVTATVAYSGQRAVISFDAVAGQVVQVMWSNLDTAAYRHYYLRKPDGSELRSNTYSQQAAFYWDQVTLPVTGTYTLLYNPGYDPSSATIQIIYANVAGTISIGGGPVTMSVPIAGQTATLTFDAAAGQAVGFLWSGLDTSHISHYYLRRPDGTTLTSNTSTSVGSFRWDEVTLPVSGTYTLLYDPWYNPGSATIQIVHTIIPASVAIAGPATTVAVPYAGQQAVISFDAAAGQQVGFLWSGLDTSHISHYYLRKPDGTTLRSNTSTSVGSFRWDEVTLPVSGTYTLLYDPWYNPGSATIQIVTAIVPASAAIAGPATTVAVPYAGQRAVISFDAAAGQQVGFLWSGLDTSHISHYYLRRPDGTTLKSNTSTSVGSFRWDQVTLPVAGTYTLLYDPWFNPGSATIQIVTAIIPVTATIGGSAVTATIPHPGQQAVISFSATAGQKVTIPWSNLTFGGLADYYLASPDGSTLTSNTSFSGTSFTWSQVTLPVSGTYTILVDPSGNTGSATMSIADVSGLSMSTLAALKTKGTAAAHTNTYSAEGSESWIPDEANLSGADWKSHRDGGGIAVMPPLKAPAGVTALAGQVLLINGRPLRGVTLSIDGHTAVTDITGRFLVTGLDAGHDELSIDGRTASSRGRSFGVYEAGVEITAGITNVLPYTIWMTRLDTEHAVTFPSPTTRETVLTTPKIPGFEIRLPKGSVVEDEDGDPVTSLSITAIPVDRPPFPLPPGVVTPVYFTVQPGGSYVFPNGAQIVYPNTTGMAPGTRVEFWDYDPDVKGWYIYGHGTVTPNGKQVVPDPGVRVWEFSGAMINVVGLLKALFGAIADLLAFDGDPVDLGTGLFMERHTDLTLPDIMPISVTRTYRQLDNASRPFGVGTNFDYGIFLQSASQYTEADLAFPDSSSVHYVRTSAGTGYADAVFAAVNTTGPFRGSTIAWNGEGWDLTRTDGMVYVFGELQPLQAIRDRHGNQITITRTNGQAGNITQVTSPSGRWIRFSYDSANRISQAWDDAGRTVGYDYDSSGRLTHVHSPGGAVTQYGYNTANAMTTITDPRGITYLTNTYDTAGKVATQQLADGLYQFAYVTDAGGYSTQATVTAPNGVQRRVTFDASHRVISQTEALGTSLQRTSSVTRDPVTHLVQSATDPYGRITTIGYDSTGNPTTITEYATTPNAQTTTLSYGAPFGQISSIEDWTGRITSFGYNTVGDVTSSTDAEGRTSHVDYDPTGRPTIVTDTAGHATQLSYQSGEPIAVTDPLGRTTRRFIDAAGRTTSVIDPAGARSSAVYDLDNNLLSSTDPLGQTTAYGHDPNGNLTTVTDPRGHTTSYLYDTSDRIITRTDPLTHVAQATYDSLGRPTTITDPRGKLTTLQYDTLGRLTFAGYGTTAGPSYESSVTYAYDTLDRLATATDTAYGIITLGYNAVDQVTSVTTPEGIVGYTYGPAGLRATTSIPGQDLITYTYDSTDLINTITQGAATTTWHYDTAGRVSSIDQPGSTTTYTYDNASQLATSAITNPGGTPIGDLRYTYDATGRIAAVAGTLATVAMPAMHSSFTYNDADQLTARDGQTFTYDPAGNLTGDTSRTYGWDARGQLASITAGIQTVGYTYDTVGRRSGKTINGATTSYLYDGPNIVRETTATGITARLTAGADETLQRTGADGTRTLITDGLGSTIGLFNPATGTTTTSYAYDPYGKATTTGAASTNTQLYTGREYDPESGLQNHRARYYSPDLGRFISQDPAGFGGGSTNLYQYANNDPINLSDPNGDCPMCATMAVGCAAGGLINIGIGWGIASLAGRKYSVGNGLRDFGTGCVAGALFEFGGAIFRIGRAGGAAAEVGELELITARLQALVDKAVVDLARGTISMSAKQARRAITNPGLKGAFEGSVIDKAVKAAVKVDPYLRTRVGTTGLFRFGPDFFLRSGGTWWDVTTPGEWAKHILRYTTRYGNGIPLLY